MGPSLLLLVLVLQGLIFHDQSLASFLPPQSLNYSALLGDDKAIRPYDFPRTNRQVNEGRLIVKDNFGVERSVQPFKRPPQLYLDINDELKSTSFKTSVQKAEDLLKREDFRGSQGTLIKAAWETAIKRTSITHCDFLALPEKFKQDPVKVAAHVYSMDEAFKGKKLYVEFNDITSKYQSSGSSYKDYPFKGLYGLLLQNMKEYTQEAYRGVSFPVDAEKNKYIRFNRFTSTSFTKSVAQNFAGSKGTLFIIKGKKLANFITPYSQITGEDEYLLSPAVQFLVLDVDKSKTPWVIIMQPVDYSA